jgi:hypothetical protein
MPVRAWSDSMCKPRRIRCCDTLGGDVRRGLRARALVELEPPPHEKRLLRRLEKARIFLLDGVRVAEPLTRASQVVESEKRQSSEEAILGLNGGRGIREPLLRELEHLGCLDVPTLSVKRFAPVHVWAATATRRDDGARTDEKTKPHSTSLPRPSFASQLRLLNPGWLDLGWLVWSARLYPGHAMTRSERTGERMGIKEEMMKRGMQMMSDPRVMKLMQNPQFMKVMMTAIQVPGKVNSFTNEQARHLASGLRLATAEELKDLQRTVKRLERELAKLQDQIASSGR